MTGISKRDAATFRVASLLGEGMVGRGEVERARQLIAGAEVGVVATKKDLKTRFEQQFAGMDEQQLKAAEAALFDVSTRRELAAAPEWNAEDIDEGDDD